jgi:hypothetical protein
MATYIIAVSVLLTVLGMASVVILFSNPKTFRVPSWVKALGYTNFIIDMAGAMLIIGHFQIGWPRVFHDLGTAMILTSGAGLLGVFLYVHIRVVPVARKG